MKTIFLAAFCAALTVPSFAQHPTAEAPGDKHRTTHLANPPVAGISEAEAVAVLDLVNQDEIAFAQKAVEKSKNEEVLAFARQMIVDHGENRRKLGEIGIQPANGELSNKLRDKHLGISRKLDRAEGSDFDRAYIGAMVDGHNGLLEKIDKKLAPAAKTAALATHVQDTRPVVEAHLEHARRIKRGLGTK
ncbi:MAG: DUF4142 domain-containing protein [Elusimicrobiota bacterium]|nr:MAG: DUF4142 domain-containing protein [Elusimicrobiota bacterium]